VVYIPSSTINYFVSFEQLLENLTPSYTDIIIMGDFNTCLLKNDSRSQKLRSLVSSINLDILPLSETHFPPNFDPSLLDLIISSNPQKVLAHGQLTAPFSYHDLLFLRYNLRSPKRKHKVILQRNFKKINIEQLNKDASNIDWTSVYEATDINVKVKLFASILIGLFDSHAPVRPVTIKHLPAPWLTDTIKKLMAKRNKAKAKCKKDPTVDNVASYKRLRNLCNRMCRDAKRRYIHSSIENSSTTEKWRFLKSLGVVSMKSQRASLRRAFFLSLLKLLEAMA
ncbi:jg23237, partial [Pararge aegeria aegeria]